MKRPVPTLISTNAAIIAMTARVSPPRGTESNK